MIRRLYSCFIVFVFAIVSISTSATAQLASARRSAADSAELRTARVFDAERSNPLELHAFLYAMPKGADLHYHLTGGVYAETWIRDGV